MQYAEILYSQTEPFLVLVLFFLLLLAGEAGYRYGRRRRARTDEVTRSQMTTLQGAILGLLGLLLGFTFAMAVSRFDSRKQLVVDEANAIGTAYLRARLLPEPERTEVVTLLRQYLDTRLEMTRASAAAAATEGLDGKLARLQEHLWSAAAAVNTKDRRAVATGLFIQSLNEVVDVAARRDAALKNHVPESVLFLLAVVATLSLAVVGHGCGLGSGRAVFGILALSGLIAVVTLIIVDLDRPRQGLLRVGEKSMIELKNSLEQLKP